MSSESSPHRDPADAPDAPSREEPPRRPARPTTPLLAWLLLALLFLVFLVSLPQVAEHIQYGLERGKARAEAEAAREILQEFPEAINRVRYAAEAVAPSVVGVETARTAARRRRGGYYDETALAPAEAGSGVIVEKDGHIVTNFHVVAGADEISIRVADGRVFRNVQVLGVDPGKDLAVLKIDAMGLTPAPWGDSEALKVGDTVLAIGNPFELAHTVTAGIVSAKERRLSQPSRDWYQEFLQHDAAVNPGNSGGPLVNLKGEIVGINTAIFGTAYQGVSFAIPSSIARKVYEQLKSGKPVVRGWLGVEMQEVNEPLAERFGLPSPRGVVVVAVQPNSPANKAGIQAGDVIVLWNGKRVDKPTDLRMMVTGTDVGSQATVAVFRDGKQIEIKVQVGEQPAKVEPTRRLTP